MKTNLLIAFLIVFSRFFALNISPPSPYWEEVALGYDAYSIAQTAKDHHGNFLPLTAFESFGDYKPSLYFYAAVPFIKIFGLNTFAVRLPTVLASIAIIFGTAILAKTLFRKFYLKNDEKAASFIYYIALFLASISPWLIMFSRSAWESTLATALIVWGINFYLFFIFSNKGKWIILSTIFLSLSTYAYHAARVSAPLIGLFLTIYYLFLKFSKKNKVNWQSLLLSGLIVLVIFVPIAQSLFAKTGQQRIAETSIFSDISIIEQSNEAIENHGRTKLNKIIYHRYLFFAKAATINFLDHFNFKYLFISGDNNPRHSLQSFGQFYYLDLILLIFTLIFFSKKKSTITGLLFLCLFVTILPASFTRGTPHALRTLAALPIFIVLLGFGFWQFLELFKLDKLRKLVLKVFAFAYVCFFASFFYELIYIYPNKYKHEWQFGYQEMINKLTKIEKNYEKIYITREQGRPAMYYFFYAKIDPSLVQYANQLAKKDQGEFLEFQKIEFIDKPEQIDFNKEALIISSPDFYQNSFSKDSIPIIDATEEQTWVFYEIN